MARQILLFVPPVRMVALISRVAPPLEGNDYGGYSIEIDTCPVVALQRQVTGEDATHEFDAVIAQEGDVFPEYMLPASSFVAKYACPWPPEEDAERLKDEFEYVRSNTRYRAEYLIGQGHVLFYDVGHLPFPRPDDPRIERRPEERKAESVEPTESVEHKTEPPHIRRRIRGALARGPKSEAMLAAALGVSLRRLRRADALPGLLDEGLVRQDPATGLYHLAEESQ